MILYVVPYSSVGSGKMRYAMDAESEEETALLSGSFRLPTEIR